MAKAPWMSKTIWIALLSALAAFFPPVQQWIAANPQIFAQVLSIVFVALRLVTNGKISIGE